MDANPPHLTSPVDNLVVYAVLDQDASLTAGLAVADDGQRRVVLVAAEPGHPSQREEFLAWGRALSDIARVARVAPVAGFGHTPDGRAYLATHVERSLADYLRVAGQLDATDVRGIGAVLADALATAHSYGIAHAAVSPATVLIGDDGAYLGGFGATAPTLSGPLGVWAFTAPEHRRSAAASAEVSSPAADVFALAATMCVVLAGALPWSDPTTWADAARLPSGPDAPGWVAAIRAALAPDPDHRPSAEEFAHALRVPAAQVPIMFHGAKVDVRAFIPRTVRRLAADNIDAMADGLRPASGRARPPVVRAAGRVRRLARTHRSAGGVAATAVIVGAAIASFSVVEGGATDALANGPAPMPTGLSATNLKLMIGARTASESWLRKVGAGDMTACESVLGRRVITTAASVIPISCGYLVANRSSLLPAKAVRAMRSATVLQVSGLTLANLRPLGTLQSTPQVGDGQPGSPDPSPRPKAPTSAATAPTTSNNHGEEHDVYAYVSLPSVPALAPTLHRLEITMSYHDGRWWVAAVVVS